MRRSSRLYVCAHRQLEVRQFGFSSTGQGRGQGLNAPLLAALNPCHSPPCTEHGLPPPPLPEVDGQHLFLPPHIWRSSACHPYRRYTQQSRGWAMGGVPLPAILPSTFNLNMRCLTFSASAFSCLLTSSLMRFSWMRRNAASSLCASLSASTPTHAVPKEVSATRESAETCKRASDDCQEREVSLEQYV